VKIPTRTGTEDAAHKLGMLGLVACAMFAVFGCAAPGDSTEGPSTDATADEVADESADETTGETADETVAADLEPTLDNVQKHVFDEACATAGCHSAEHAVGGLDLSNADASYASLVGQPAANPAAAESQLLLVAPDDPEQSFLCNKLEDPSDGEGSPMPPGGYQVAPEYIDLIEDWIADGAKR